MTEKKRAKARRKKVRYKNLEFKLSLHEYALITRYCRKHKLTPNKLIKKSLRIYMERFGPLLDHVPAPVSDNQLTIFDAGAGEPPTEILINNKSHDRASVKG